MRLPSTLTTTAALGCLTALLAVGLQAPTAAHADSTTVNSVVTSGVPAVIYASNEPSQSAFTVSFQGPPATNANVYQGYDWVITPLEVNAPEPVRYLPQVIPATGNLTPGTPLSYRLNMWPATATGHYRLDIPITQGTWDGSKMNYTTAYAAPVTFDVRATSAYALTQSYLNISGKFSKSQVWRFNYDGKYYHQGSTLKVYYKPKGAKSYTKLFTKTLNAVGGASYATTKGKILKPGTGYYTVSAAKYADAIKGTFSIKKG